MKLKYYLRGIGIGVFVTAIIMSLSTKPEQMTDAQIKLRAAELGMVEESVLADLEKMTETTDEQEEATLEKEETAEEAITETVATDNFKEETTEEKTANDTSEEVVKVDDGLISNQEIAKEDIAKEDSNLSTQKQDSSGEKTLSEAEENYIIITINRGNGSDTVSRKLMEAGLVNSASEFDKYLIANGYDRRLSIGDHEIPVGASEEEMAKILCGMQ